SLNPEQDRLISSLQQSGEEMLKLIDNLLGASSLVTGDVVLDERPYRIEHVIESIRLQKSALIEQKNLTFEVHIDEDVPQRLIGDERRLEQVLGALVDNAIKFTSQGGVKLKVFRQPTDIALSDTEDEAENLVECLLLEVSDTGPGIEASQLHRVNELFHQIDGDSSRRFGGSGLGLSIANSLVELMKGKLKVSSALCEGTRVLVSLPLHEVPHDESVDTQTHAISTAKESGSEKTRALVVEDNPINQMVMEAILEELNCEVTLAENGLRAMHVLEEQGFDIVFMDCQMPELDGYSTTRRARASGLTIPIVAVTANAMTGDRQKCLSAGMDDYVSKPFTQDTIKHMLHKWIGNNSLQFAS
ncbi:MAG: response regulator, partial [Granulosicoccus sp.]